ncbi:MAG: sigma-54 dependent transcriptional regulator [Gammaproteobacteria bacterium]|nr:sigma-54 dependent transcriptional regulator [Gammaproteobacteria bacterium]
MIENYPTTSPTAMPQPRNRNKILIVDDDVAGCRTLQLHLSSEGYDVAVAHNVDEGLAATAKHQPHLVILDIRMPGRSGIEGLPEFKSAIPGIHVIMITAFQDMDSTIQAMQSGADDYIHKPIDIDELDDVIGRLLSSSNKNVLAAHKQEESNTAKNNPMVGRSRAMKEVFKTIGLVANNPVTVLITGESGTGKELVARAIHRVGYNSTGSFVAINCAALVETLLESEMFGHEKGSFTGAVCKQQGKFALANNGSIFLDELSELSLTMQAKLLRVLQEKEFTPVGGKTTEKTNARVIAATNADLEKRVQEGRFREDLFYRLHVVTIQLPPLRERQQDITELVQVLLARINKQMHRNVTQVSMDVIDNMQKYSWPGNVRELENVLAKAVALCPGNTITCDLVNEISNSDSLPQSIDHHRDISHSLCEMSLEEVEKIHVIRVLEATRWHKGRTCEILGVSRPRLRRMIKHFEIAQPADIPDDEEDAV